MPVIRPTEDAIFCVDIFRTSMEKFRPTLGASLIRDFSGNHSKILKFIFPFLKTVP